MSNCHIFHRVSCREEQDAVCDGIFDPLLCGEIVLSPRRLEVGSVSRDCKGREECEEGMESFLADVEEHGCRVPGDIEYGVQDQIVNHLFSDGYMK